MPYKFISLLCKHTLDVSGPELVTVSDLCTPQGTKNYPVQNSAIFWKSLPSLPHVPKWNIHISRNDRKEEMKSQNISANSLKEISGSFQIMLLLLLLLLFPHSHLTWIYPLFHTITLDSLGGKKKSCVFWIGMYNFGKMGVWRYGYSGQPRIFAATTVCQKLAGCWILTKYMI